MKKCEFCEKIYEIFIINELLNRYKDADVYSPSQVKEAKLGYDALFNFHNNRKLVVLQFKICDEYIKKPSYLINGKCFRFQLHPNNNYYQHNSLVRKHNSKKYLSGYFVPYFNKYNELYLFHHRNIIIDNSIFITSNQMINDGKSHFINFDADSAYQHSNEMVKIKNIKGIDLDKIIEELDYISKEEFYDIILNGNEDNSYYLLL